MIWQIIAMKSKVDVKNNSKSIYIDIILCTEFGENMSEYISYNKGEEIITIYYF